ncbi:hypothetical protein [Methylobacterium sp. JK268]
MSGLDADQVQADFVALAARRGSKVEGEVTHRVCPYPDQRRRKITYVNEARPRRWIAVPSKNATTSRAVHLGPARDLKSRPAVSCFTDLALRLPASSNGSVAAI